MSDSMGRGRIRDALASRRTQLGRRLPGRAWSLGALFGGALLCVPASACAVEGDVGVSVGGIVAGSTPRLAISPHAGIAWPLGEYFRLGIRNFLSILPGIDPHGIGVYNHLSATGGLVWRAGDIFLGPSFGIFSMPMCGGTLCARLTGVGPGGTVQASVYFAGPLGISARLNVDWVSGFGNVLPPSWIAVVVAGPVFHWGAK